MPKEATKSEPVHEKPVGVPVESKKIGPEMMFDRPWSLNYKSCDYIELPSRTIRLDHENPTIIPRQGQISQIDLVCLFKNALLKKIIPGETPAPKFDKNPDAMRRHTDFLRLRLPISEIKEYIGNIVTGASNDGGYTKLEILETMLETEEVNPLTRKGGQNRPDVVKELRAAIDFVVDRYGGRISSVTTEVSPPAQKPVENSGTYEPTGPKPNIAAILGLK